MEKVMADVFENVTQANKKAVDAVISFNKIALRAQSQLARQQLAAFENCLEAGTKQLKLASESRDPKELMAAQSEVAVALGEKLVAVAQESLEIQAKTRDELAAWMEDGFKAVKMPDLAKATSELAKVTKAAAKSAATKAA